MPARLSDVEWIASGKYSLTGEGCWQWNGSICRDGYGKCNRRAGQFLAHRAFYTILVGPIKAGFELDHLCKNRSCVNPAHLEEVTHTENVRRGDYTSNHRNRRKTHCKRGHALTDDNVSVRPSGARRCTKCSREYHRIRGNNLSPTTRGTDSQTGSDGVEKDRAGKLRQQPPALNTNARKRANVS